MLIRVHRGSPPSVDWPDCDGWGLADTREPRRMRPYLRPARPAGRCQQREPHHAACTVPALVSAPADSGLTRWPTRSHARSLAWAELALFWEAGLFRPRYGVKTCSPAPM